MPSCLVQSRGDPCDDSAIAKADMLKHMQEEFIPVATDSGSFASRSFYSV